MTVEFDTKYPAALTNATWQKQKSFLDKAKSKTKTGLGELLVTAEAAWKAIPFKALDARTAKAKSAESAQENLARAKQIKTTELKAGREAVVKAMKLAQAQAKNKALSEKARAAAGAIAAGLDTLNGHLLGVSLDDLAREPERLAAAQTGDLALHDVDLRRRGGATANGPKAVRRQDGTLTVSGLVWEPTAGDPKKLLKTLLTVRATQPDNSIFVNDMILSTLSNDLKTARFKNP